MRSHRSHGRKKQVPFSMTVEKVKLMQECFPQHLHTVTARMKEDEKKERKEREKKKCLFKLKTFDITMSTYIS